MTVTNITAQQKNVNRVNVFVDGQYEFSLTIDEVLEHKVKVGLQLDEHSLKNLQRISSDGKLKARTYDWLLRRPRSKKELIDYLKTKDADEHQIKNLCNYFNNRGLQNDKEFTKWWIEQRQNNFKSKRSIVAELKIKGISQDIIANNLQQETSDIPAIKSLIHKKRLLNKYPDKPKLINYLATKGFNYSDIVDVLAGLNIDGDSF